jgi:hypothetical protein
LQQPALQTHSSQVKFLQLEGLHHRTQRQSLGKSGDKQGGNINSSILHCVLIDFPWKLSGAQPCSKPLTWTANTFTLATALWGITAWRSCLCLCKLILANNPRSRRCHCPGSLYSELRFCPLKDKFPEVSEVQGSLSLHPHSLIRWCSEGPQLLSSPS